MIKVTIPHCSSKLIFRTKFLTMRQRTVGLSFRTSIVWVVSKQLKQYPRCFLLVFVSHYWCMKRVFLEESKVTSEEKANREVRKHKIKKLGNKFTWQLVRNAGVKKKNEYRHCLKQESNTLVSREDPTSSVSACNQWVKGSCSSLLFTKYMILRKHCTLSVA